MTALLAGIAVVWLLAAAVLLHPWRRPGRVTRWGRESHGRNDATVSNSSHGN